MHIPLSATGWPLRLCMEGCYQGNVTGVLRKPSEFGQNSVRRIMHACLYHAIFSCVGGCRSLSSPCSSHINAIGGCVAGQKKTSKFPSTKRQLRVVHSIAQPKQPSLWLDLANESLREGEK